MVFFVVAIVLLFIPSILCRRFILQDEMDILQFNSAFDVFIVRLHI